MKKVIKRYIAEQAKTAHKIFVKQEQKNNKLKGDMALLFKEDTLFIHDCIAQIIDENFLDKNNLDIRNALMQIAIGVKNKFNPLSQASKPKQH